MTRLATWCTASLLPAVLAVLALTGCDAGVDPVLGTERAYTLYGFFDARSDTQAVRVLPVADRLERRGPEPIDAVVTATRLRTGETVTLRDSLVAFGGDRFGHVYWAPWAVAYAEPYRLTATRSDGVQSSVEVQVPPRTEPLVREFVTDARSLLVVVAWPGAPNLNEIEVTYHLAPDTLVDDTLVPVEYTFSYGFVAGEGASTDVVIDYLRDTRSIIADELLERGGPNPRRPIRLCEVDVRVLVSSDGWIPPDGAYDPEILVEPGTFSNVDNGFGFFGAGYVDTLRWDPPADVLRSGGFEPEPCDVDLREEEG